MADRELELRQFLRILWRYKFFIALIAIVSFTAAAVGSTYLTKIYETSVSLRIGVVWGAAIDDSDRVAESINSAPFAERVRKRLKLPEGAHSMHERGLISAEVVDENTGKNRLVTIIARGESPEQTHLFVDTATAFILEGHKPIFESLVKENGEHEARLRAQLEAAEQDQKRLVRHVEELSKKKDFDPAALLLLQVQLKEQGQNIIQLLELLRQASTNNSSEALTRPTELEYPSVRPQIPIKPRRMLLTILTTAVGTITATLLSLLVEYMKRTEPGNAS